MGISGVTTQPNDVELSWDETIEAIALLRGERVAVRVVERANPETLIVAMRGHLDELTDDRLPTYFLRVRASSEDEADDLESTGIYLRSGMFEGAVRRGDITSLLITQGPVVVNLRSLDADDAG
jgi:hypothetical protein